MPRTTFLTLTQQVVRHLREEISTGRWSGMMPGKKALAAELEISQKTVDTALQELERMGVLVSQGAGRNRRIEPQEDDGKATSLRLGLLLWDETDRAWPFMLDLQHRLGVTGHSIIDPKKSLMGLKMSVLRIARLVAVLCQNHRAANRTRPPPDCDAEPPTAPAAGSLSAGESLFGHLGGMRDSKFRVSSAGLGGDACGVSGVLEGALPSHAAHCHHFGRGAALHRHLPFSREPGPPCPRTGVTGLHGGR